MLPLAAIVYSYASIASVIWKSEHRVHRGVIISGERSNVFQSHVYYLTENRLTRFDKSIKLSPSHNAHVLNTENRLNSRLRSNVKTRRLMTLIIALILAYVICWTPWHLFHILTAFNVRIQFETCDSFFSVYNWSVSTLP